MARDGYHYDFNGTSTETAYRSTTLTVFLSLLLKETKIK